MKRLKKIFMALVISILLPVSPKARADMFGGDVVVLTQILANAIEQLIQLREVLATGNDTLSLLQEVNRGIKEGLGIIQMINPKFNPGLFANLSTADEVLAVISDLYGRIPVGAEARVLQLQDQAVAESISMNSSLFKVADQADLESQRILERARDVNPQGAAKLTVQSLAVLIGVTTQVLRSNSMILKMAGQNMAITNRRGKLESEQFRSQYGGLAKGIKNTKSGAKLNSLRD